MERNSRMENGRANRPGETIGFTDPGRLEHPTPRRSPMRLPCATGGPHQVAELGPSEGLHVIVTSGDAELKAAGIVSLFQVPGSPARQLWSPLITPKES